MMHELTQDEFDRFVEVMVWKHRSTLQMYYGNDDPLEGAAFGDRYNRGRHVVTAGGQDFVGGVGSSDESRGARMIAAEYGWFGILIVILVILLIIYVAKRI